MRIFVYEYACAQPRDADLPESIRVEGRAMLDALREDFARIPGVELEKRLSWHPGGLHYVLFTMFAGDADWTVVIAPESNDKLLEWCRRVKENEARLLGPGLNFIKRTGDKWTTHQAFTKHGVRTPRTWLAEDVGRIRRQCKGPFVVKPRCGAGSQDTTLASAKDLTAREGFIVQEYAPGMAASVSFLAPALVPLCPTQQLLSDDGRFRYLGGRLPLPEPLARRAVELATKALRPFRNVFGYVGVDLVLGDASDGRADYVIEINPRLTTSYVGLRALAIDNLAEVMLRMAEGEKVAPVRWKQGAVEFDARGGVSYYTNGVSSRRR